MTLVFDNMTLVHILEIELFTIATDIKNIIYTFLLRVTIPDIDEDDQGN